VASLPARQRRVVQAISASREEVGLSQRELSRRLKRYPTYIQRIERMQRNLNVAEFFEIAVALDVDLKDFVDKVMQGSEAPRRNPAAKAPKK